MDILFLQLILKESQCGPHILALAASAWGQL